MPAMFSYLTVEKQQAAAAIASAVQAVNLVVAGVFIQLSAMAVDAMGAGPFFSLLAGVEFIVVGGANAYTWHAVRQCRKHVAERGGGDGAVAAVAPFAV